MLVITAAQTTQPLDDMVLEVEVEELNGMIGIGS
jgi:hypothetical protein